MSIFMVLSLSFLARDSFALPSVGGDQKKGPPPWLGDGPFGNLLFRLLHHPANVLVAPSVGSNKLPIVRSRVVGGSSESTDTTPDAVVRGPVSGLMFIR